MHQKNLYTSAAHSPVIHKANASCQKLYIQNALAHRPIVCVAAHGRDELRTAQMDLLKLTDPTESRYAAICNYCSRCATQSSIAAFSTEIPMAW